MNTCTICKREIDGSYPNAVDLPGGLCGRASCRRESDKRQNQRRGDAYTGDGITPDRDLERRGHALIRGYCGA